ncbi:MAG: 3-deoxy-manno-octulosonate cytidylyltransferase [Magnetococcales bacterium]|nr:3-deoxy-manno-octulosonate cytidylyltransferase [Magnetococcales bacterium]
MAPRVIAIIPSRFSSQRLPGKPLLPMAGKPMIQHVYERAIRARLDDVIVATDDERIQAAVQGFGGRVVMTRTDHLSGTDRVAEAALGLDADFIVNIQGDEPLLDPEAINQAVTPFLTDDRLVMSTLAHRITQPAEIMDPNVVKVVCNAQGFALYFSRAPIPWARYEDHGPPGAWRHIGLYVFGKDFLALFAALPPTPLEKREGLEQLRALEHGYPIRVVPSNAGALGVDTRADYEKVRCILEQGEQS